MYKCGMCVFSGVCNNGAGGGARVGGGARAGQVKGEHLLPCWPALTFPMRTVVLLPSVTRIHIHMCVCSSFQRPLRGEPLTFRLNGFSGAGCLSCPPQTSTHGHAPMGVARLVSDWFHACPRHAGSERASSFLNS